MIYLLFTARRRGTRRWRIWVRARAGVYEWLQVHDIDDDVAKALAEMDRRDYEIEHVRVAPGSRLPGDGSALLERP